MQDYDEAIIWLRKAANAGFSEAHYNLDRAYEEGDGVTVNHEIANTWFKKSAAQGYKLAKVKLNKHQRRIN